MNSTSLFQPLLILVLSMLPVKAIHGLAPVPNIRLSTVTASTQRSAISTAQIRTVVLSAWA